MDAGISSWRIEMQLMIRYCQPLYDFLMSGSRTIPATNFTCWNFSLSLKFVSKLNNNKINVSSLFQTDIAKFYLSVLVPKLYSTKSGYFDLYKAIFYAFFRGTRS